MKRLLIGATLLLACVLAAGLAGFAENGNVVKTDPEIVAILKSINPDRIQNTDIALQNFFTRNSCSDTLSPGKGVTPARDYIFKRYSALHGLQVKLDPFTHPNCPTKPTYNVIAWIPGTKHPEQLVIVGGHYDSRTVDVYDTTSAAPGGNDAGGQTSVLLEIAKAFDGHQFDSTVVFISFSGEEQGLYGSGSIAANLNRYFKNPQVIAVLNTDIPGGDIWANRAQDFKAFRLYSPGIPRELGATAPDGTTDNTSPSRGLMRYVGTWGEAYVPLFTMLPIMREDRPGRDSDQSSFINQGFPAVRIMETFECSPSPVDNSCSNPLPCPPPGTVPLICTSSFLTDHQHNANDLNQFITPSYAANIAKVLASVAASLARAPVAPADFKAVGDNMQGVKVSFKESQGADHFLVAARSVKENPYYRPITLKHASNRLITPQELGLKPGDDFFVSAAAVDKQGHQSLYAYPELRCDSKHCVVVP